MFRLTFNSDFLIGAVRICLCYADNCPEIYYSVSSVESNQRPNTENKTNTGTGHQGLVTSSGSCHEPPESDVGVGAAQVVCYLLFSILAVPVYLDLSELGLFANQGKILVSILYSR